jgi:RimJ/RimL family protein N-acetyltransferase
MAEQGSPALVKIRAVAVAVGYRGQGGSLADEALEVALETAAARGREEGLDAVRLVGWVDPRNDASKRLNTRAGFACRKITSDGLEEWVLELNLG